MPQITWISIEEAAKEMGYAITTFKKRLQKNDFDPKLVVARLNRTNRQISKESIEKYKLQNSNYSK